MTRTDQDTWDLASSVGATATWVAACRALAGKQTDALIDDPFADPLVRAVGAEFFIRVLDGEITDATLDEVRQAAETLLANTVIEQFDVVVEDADGGVA